MNGLVDAALVWWAVASVRSDTGSPQGEVLSALPPVTSTPRSTSEPRTAPASGGASAAVAWPTMVLAALNASLESTRFLGGEQVIGPGVASTPCDGSPAEGVVVEVTGDGCRGIRTSGAAGVLARSADGGAPW